MKKKLNIVLSLLTVGSFILCFFTGCSSVKVDLKNYSPIAIVSVYSNSHLPWYDKDDSSSGEDDSGDGLLNNAISGVIGKNDPEIMSVQNRVDYAADSLVKSLEVSGVDVLDHDIVQNSRALSGRGAGWLSFMETKTSASGFYKITSASTKKTRDLLRETGGKSAAIAYFKFQKEKINSGLFDIDVRARCVLQIYVYDELGHKLVGKEYVGYSWSTTPYKNGVWDKEAVCNFMSEATDSAIAQFVFDYTSIFSGENLDSKDDVTATPLLITKPENSSNSVEPEDVNE